MNTAEALESRRLLASVSLTGKTLLVDGNRDAANTVTVVPNGTAKIDLVLTTTDPGNVPVVITRQYNKSAVNLIKIRGGDRADGVQIGGATTSVLIAVRVDAYGGNDTITTSSGRDMVSGGPGDDSIRTGSGVDFIMGNRGNDSINAGSGNNIAWGGRGDDSINGGAGDDAIGAILGSNNITGGSGRDQIYLKSGATGQVDDFVNGVDKYRFFSKASIDGEENSPVTKDI